MTEELSRTGAWSRGLGELGWRRGKGEAAEVGKGSTVDGGRMGKEHLTSSCLNEPRPLPTPRGCGAQWLLFGRDPSSLCLALFRAASCRASCACACPSHALWLPCALEARGSGARARGASAGYSHAPPGLALGISFVFRHLPATNWL